MSITVNGTAPSPGPAATSKISATILGFFAGFAVKSGLDALCKHLPESTGSLPSVLSEIGLIPFLSFVLFFLIIVRFLYGALRFQEEMAPGDSSVLALWNVLMALGLFVVLSLSGQVVRFPLPFFSSLIAVHLVDWVWFGINVHLGQFADRIESVMRQFMFIDLVTTVTLAGVILIRHSAGFNDWVFLFLGGMILVTMSIYDLVKNRAFFFHPDQWRNEGGQ